jgi:hypothetical protein
MKKNSVFLGITLVTTICFGQITTTKIASKSDQDKNTAYDSTQNFLGKEVYKYLGQELYVKGMHKDLQKYGYFRDFDYFADATNSNYYSFSYDNMVGKYFKVIDIIKHPKAEEQPYLYANKYYLKLQEKTTNDTIQYIYDAELSEFSFPFIVVGFFEKAKKRVIGKEFVIDDSYYDGATDIVTTKAITVRTGQKWKCIDLTIEEEYYELSLILQNSLGEKIFYGYARFVNGINSGVYSSTEADKYRQRFGGEIFNTILKGKVKIGMTKEMCRLSWGEPAEINVTITSGKRSEQWVYRKNYLYFSNGILTAIQ